MKMLFASSRAQTGSKRYSFRPIKACIQIIREKLSMLETTQNLEQEGFEELVKGSEISVEQSSECINVNCYFTTEDALKHKLVQGILR
jgi:ATP-dependent Clp protease, protease subunit